MASALREAGFQVVNVSYPSRTADIQTLSDLAIGAALDDPTLENCLGIHFVTHSLGGILVRDYYSRHVADKLRRVVMLGPPNKGSEVVDNLRSWWLFQKLNGPAGSQLGTDPGSIPNQLGPVNFELGIIAGSRSINWINSLMINGPNDGKVSIARTRIEGMKAHIVLPATHPFLMKNRKAIAQTVVFLRSGCFES